MNISKPKRQIKFVLFVVLRIFPISEEQIKDEVHKRFWIRGLGHVSTLPNIHRVHTIVLVATRFFSQFIVYDIQ